MKEYQKISAEFKDSDEAQDLTKTLEFYNNAFLLFSQVRFDATQGASIKGYEKMKSKLVEARKKIFPVTCIPISYSFIRLSVCKEHFRGVLGLLSASFLPLAHLGLLSKCKIDCHFVEEL